MGSMGHVVGEKVAAMIDRAIAEPGCRRRVLRLRRRPHAGGPHLAHADGESVLRRGAPECGRLPFITVLTDPTTGGVTASFAMQGDIVLAEPARSSGSPASGSSATPSSRSCRGLPDGGVRARARAYRRHRGTLPDAQRAGPASGPARPGRRPGAHRHLPQRHGRAVGGRGRLRLGGRGRPRPGAVGERIPRRGGRGAVAQPGRVGAGGG